MMKGKQKSGRPSAQVCVVPVSLEKPDIAKLGRALLAVAQKLQTEKSQNSAKEDIAA